jgi:glutaryl-CoA dehydrogenase
MAPYRGVDFLHLDPQFTDEELLVRETVREFVSEQVLPCIEKHHREGTFPMHLIPEIARLGLLGSTIQGYGCPGLNNVAYGLIMQELERGDSAIRSFVSVQGALVMYPIYTFGSAGQKENWLPKLANGTKIGCFGLTEHDFGSNPGGMRTRATRKGDCYILNGSKMWITNGSISDVAVVWARTENGGADDCIRGFIVEKGSRGFSSREIHGKFSLRASVTAELIFEDCEIPASNLLPGTVGLKSALMCLSQARYGIAWGAIGAAMACYHEALQYALTRKQWAEKVIAGHQLVQEKLVYMITEITKAQLLCLQLGRLKDNGECNFAQVSMAKRNNVQIALETARLARDMLGANGIMDEYPVIRHMLNLESVKTYEGTHDIHTLIIGQQITGIPAFE